LRWARDTRAPGRQDHRRAGFHLGRRQLETAQDDNIEASELLSRPTETLLNIRRKWERGQSISRAEWQVFGYYLQVGCESPTEEEIQLPTAESYATCAFYSGNQKAGTLLSYCFERPR